MWRTRFVLQGVPAAPQYFITTLTFSIKLQLLRFGHCTNDFNYMLINCAAQLKKILFNADDNFGRCASSSRSPVSLFFFLVGAKDGGRELFDDPSYVNVDKPRPPVAANGNAHRDAFDMSKCLTWSISSVLRILYHLVLQQIIDKLPVIKLDLNYFDHLIICLCYF